MSEGSHPVKRLNKKSQLAVVMMRFALPLPFLPLFGVRSAWSHLERTAGLKTRVNGKGSSWLDIVPNEDEYER